MVRKKRKGTRWHRTQNRLVSSLLSLVLLLALLPGMSMTAYADDPPYASLKNTTTVVHFDNKDWYLIDYDSSSSTVTLLTKECVGASTFAYNSGVYDGYSGSAVEKVVNEWYESNISEEAKSAVNGNGMFLLSFDEAMAIYDSNRNVLQCSQASGSYYNYWWLRSQGVDNTVAACVFGETGEIDNRNRNLTLATGVRPALKLNLSSVIFASVDLSGGGNATASGESSIKNTFYLNTTTIPSITTITYTAITGYQFPETSSYYKTTNGIIVARTSDTVVTISGSPTASASITVPDTVHTHSFTYAASGTTITATCATGCTANYDTNPFTLTLNAPESPITYDGVAKTATISGYPSSAPAGLAAAPTEITYYASTGAGSITTSGSALSGAPTNAGNYVAQMAWGEQTASVAFSIDKANPTANAPTGVTATYGQTLANVTLTNPESNTAGTWEWADSTQSVGDVVDPPATFKAKFTPTDTTNYNSVSDVDVTVTVVKAAINSVAVMEITAPESGKTLDTEATTSTANVKLSAVRWTPEHTTAADATVYTATLTVMADRNYVFADDVTATVNGETANVTKNEGALSISYTFTKTNLTPVTITATDKEAAFTADGVAIPVEGMFSIPEGAGAATYTVSNGTGEGSFANNKLTVTKCGTFTVSVTTAETSTHAAGSASATLTVKDVYTVTYDANGGSGAPERQSKTQGVELTLSATAPTRDGFTFQGWAESKTATSPEYQPGGKYTKDASVTLYALWSENKTEPPTPAPDPEDPIAAFVQRCYRVILGREGEPAGVADWTNALKSGERHVAEIVSGFVNSQEFMNQQNSNGQIVNIMYEAMLGREPDDEGFANWLSVLDNGWSVDYVINGFSGSPEFGRICASYGIEAGSVALTEPRDQNPMLTAFVNRNYQYALDRQGEPSGLNDWCAALLEGRLTPQEVAYGFVFSPECVEKGLDNWSFLNMLYHLYMDRDPDEEGMNNWLAVLENGGSREDVNWGFAESPEFYAIIVSYGL